MSDTYEEIPADEEEPCWRTLSRNIVAAVRTHDGPLPFNEIGAVYQSICGQPFNLRGYKLADCLRQESQLTGALLVNWKTKTLSLKKKRRGGAPKALAAPPRAPTAPATNPRRSATAPSSATEPPVQSPEDVILTSSYHVIDSVQSCMLALIAISPDDDGDAVSLSLARICEGRVVAVQLEGRELGTEEGRLSLAKVGRYNSVKKQYVHIDVI